MFFVARSAVCIALVVGALPNQSAARRPVALSPIAARTGVAVVDRLCREAPSRCLGTIGRMMDASRDTLLAADRQPRWSGPAIVAAE